MNDITKKAKDIFEDTKEKDSDVANKAENKLHEAKGAAKNEKRHIEEDIKEEENKNTDK